MIRRISIASVIMLVCLLFSQCKKHSGMKIALMFPYTTGSRMAIEEKFMKEKVKELNAELIVTDAQNNDVLQVQQANDLISNGIDAIIIMSVNSNTAAEIVRIAHKAGVKVIAYDRMIDNCDLDFYITFNNFNVGKYMSDYALRLKPEGKYMLVGGDKIDKNAIYVRSGMLDGLNSAVKSGKVKIISDQYTDEWLEENAYVNMKEYINLSSEDIPDVVLAANDALGRGVRKALDEAGIKKEVIISGQDAEPLTIKFIAQGMQTLTIYKPLKALAENAAIIASKLINGESIEKTTTVNNNRIDVPSLLLDVIVVDKNNIKETVIKDGMVKESDVY